MDSFGPFIPYNDLAMLTYLPENEDLTNIARKRNLKFVSDLWMHFRSKKNCGPPLCDTVIIPIPSSICRRRRHTWTALYSYT